ncbi:DUF6496 domain-containing protein [Reyranella sp. CPCC 100927]|uniref:DUF6496 domain-containing protein n=1 Tax=Reyranella sp. CPCC 100927 TaxID=2599616 RepID=UPI00351A7A9E
MAVTSAGDPLSQRQSGSRGCPRAGAPVTAAAIAIGLSEARKKGEKSPAPEIRPEGGLIRNRHALAPFVRRQFFYAPPRRATHADQEISRRHCSAQG